MCVCTYISKWYIEGCVCVVCACEPVLGQDRGLEVRPSVPHLVEERGVKLRLQLLVAVTLDDLCDFLLPPHMRRVVQVTFQALPSAQADDRLTHKEPLRKNAETQTSIFKCTVYK